METIQSRFYPMIRDVSKQPFTLKPNSEFNLKYKDEWNSIVRTNKLGFRGEINQGGTLFLGDSFTVSIRINYEDTFLGILDREVATNVSNMAVGGWSTLEEKAALKKHIDKFDPNRVVLVLYLQNDVWENHIRTEKTTPWRRGKYRSWLAPISYIPGVRTMVGEAMNRSESVETLLKRRGLVDERSQFCVFEQEYDILTQQAWEETEKAVQGIVDLLDSKDVNLEVLSMPSPWQVSNDWRDNKKLFELFGPSNKKWSETTYDFSKPDKKFREFSESAGLKFHSMLQDQYGFDSSHYFKSVDHWNESGHTVVADYIKETIFK